MTLNNAEATPTALWSYSAPAAVRAFAFSGKGVRYIVGGTTLNDLMKLKVEHPQHLIDVTANQGLDSIRVRSRTNVRRTVLSMNIHP